MKFRILALCSILNAALYSYEWSTNREYPFYLYAEIGNSIPHNSQIHVDTGVWDPVDPLSVRRIKRPGLKLPKLADLTLINFDPCGYCYPPTFGYAIPLCSAPMVGLGFGYYFNDWISATFSVNHRSKFNYRALQTVVGNPDTPGFLGSKMRSLDLDSTSFMFCMKADYHVTFNLTQCYCLTLDPYATGGVGLAKNTVYNFHSVTVPTVEVGTFIGHYVQSIMPSNTTNQLAWQAGFGMEASLSEKFYIGLGYRFFNGGKFFSNNYLNDAPDGFVQPVTVPPWCGKLRTDEIVVSFKIQF